MSDSHINRRQFAGLTSAGIVGGVLGSTRSLAADEAPGEWDPARPPVVTGKPLVVQPVLMHTTFQRKENTSWRSWSKINTQQAAAEELSRIGRELDLLPAKSGFPLKIMPPVTVGSEEEAAKIHQADYDVILLYPATGSGDMLKACFAQGDARDTLIFARHSAGSVYYWYEALSTRYLETWTEEELAAHSSHNHGGPSIHDVVIDDYGEVLWRLRALYGVKNFVGQRIVALGGPWGKYDATAPDVARDRFQLEIIEVGYDDLEKRFAGAKSDARAMARAERSTQEYLALPETKLATAKQSVVDAFVLHEIFRTWMREHDAPAFTIKGCMGRVLPIARTTPCMSLSWLNDEGLLGFCESDFVVIPPGILLHYLSGKPVFMHNSTFPHKGIVTCAHCSAPRRMDGRKYEPTKVMTHYESDAGAAPKVDMAIGREVTFINPQYASGRWVTYKGIIRKNPFLQICRTQQDVEIQGNWKKLLGEVRDSHWMMTYDDCVKEVEYASKKIGVESVNISAEA